MKESNEKIKELMKTLANSIGQAFREDKEIRHAISMIEKEGYHVDLILASVTCLSKKEDEKSSDTDITEYDKSFLEKIHLRFKDDSGDES